MSLLGKFLLGLSCNAEAAANFRSSQAAAQAQMDAAGITPDQQAIVLSGDPDAIAKAIHDELGETEATAGVPVTISFHIFGPHP